MTTRAPRAGRTTDIAASERILRHLNGVADTDITLVLRCRTSALAQDVHACLAALAATPAFATVGARARGLERVERRYDCAIGATARRRVGPIDLTLSPASPDTVTVRWSHLAGDAWSMQEFVLEALARAGLGTSGAACACSSKWPAGPRPVTPSDVWMHLRRTGASFSSAVGSAWPAVAPLLVPPGSAPSRGPSEGPADPDAVAILEMRPRGGTAQRASRFSRVAAATAALLAGPTGRRCRLGITVDLRRQEALGCWSGIGNACAIGYINVRGGRDDAAAVGAKVRRLLGARFWRQQTALAAWLDAAPASAPELVANALVRRVASIAPVTVTELWRQDRPSCRQCGLPARTLPDNIEALAFPPALPPGGLTVGVTRSADRTTIVLRRAATPAESAVTWLRNLVQDRAEPIDVAEIDVLTVQSLTEGFPVLP